MKYKITLLFSLALVFTSFGQDIISIEQAIKIALEKNHDIIIADNNLHVAMNNQSLKNTGYLPTVSANAGANYSNNNAFLIDQTGQEKSIDGIEATSYNGSVAVNYGIYQGGIRKNNFEKLKTAYELADIQKQSRINSTISDVYTAYYDVARNSANNKVLIEVFEISKQRYIRTKYQFDYGQKTNLDVLNAKVDVNNDSLRMINGQILFENSKRQLNLIIGQPINSEFEVDENIEVNHDLNYDVIEGNMLANNFESKQIELNKLMAESDLKISQSKYLPNVSTSVSYGLNNANNGPASLFATQNTNGLNAGINLSWTLFDGGSTSTKVQNSKLVIENQELYKQQLDLNLMTQLANTWSNYQNQLVVISSEQLNTEVNQQNYLKSEERFKLGQITSIEFRQAQLNLLNSKLNLINAQYNAKIAEITLKKLEGILVNSL